MDATQRFHDRREAGQLLARQLADYKDRDVVVLALPRGGVPVAYEIARELGAPLDVFVVRKLGVPWQPELAMGAIAGRGTEVLNGDVVTAYNIPPHVIRAVAQREGLELQRRLQDYRGNRPLLDLRDRVVILVDDGTPADFSAVGLWYEDFSQTTDDEVRELLSYDTTETFPIGV